MGRVFGQAIALMAALLVGGCTSVIADGAGRAANTASLDGRLECVPYARLHSGVVIYGDAYTWWTQAAGRYPRKALPSAGAVMVLFDYAGPERGHLAVVRRLVSPREIRVDHANWLDDGAIYVNDPVVDVSADNDWSLVRVWNIQRGAWGGRAYPVQGFIGPASGAGVARMKTNEPPDS